MRLLEAPGLRLEPQVVAHADAMFVVLSDPALYEHEHEPPPSVRWLRERYARLESRSSPDGSQQWLNWVVRLPSSELAGYVQATVMRSRRASIAYVLGSRFWGHGLATSAVRMMIGELAASYGVDSLDAVLKASNTRSRRLLDGLGFALESLDRHHAMGVDADELLMSRRAPLS